MRIGSAVYKKNSSMRTGLRVNFVKVHKVNNIIIDCAARNAEPFRKIIDAIFFIDLIDGNLLISPRKCL